MCGIAGLIHRNGKPVDPRHVALMTQALQHRGPDGQGVWTEGIVGLGHRRLSVVDLAGGSQPMKSSDGKIVVSYNGEIYNFPELRKELRKNGWVFKTQCDTEILLALWDQKGPEMVHDLNGMFSFAIYDAFRKEVFLATDRFGQKPLYYCLNNELFAFASEPPALKHLPQLNWNLDKASLHHYLSFLTVSPPRTIYKEMKRLAGGRRILYNLNTHKLQEDLWYHLDGGNHLPLSYPEAQEQLRHLMKQAVRQRLMSDVPYGAFLSGGIDSAIITGLMQELSNEPTKTFTIGLNETLWDESADAQKTATHLGTQHFEKLVSPADPDLFISLVSHLGEPFADSSLLPTAQLSSFVREHVTVCLSGDGADEAFGGYKRYQGMKWASCLDFLPNFLRNLILKTLSITLPRSSSERTLLSYINRFCTMAQKDGLARYLALTAEFNEEEKHRIYSPEFSNSAMSYNSIQILETDFARSRATNIIEQIMNLDINRYLQDDILVKIDRASMHSSLEVRSPFLDHHVMEFVSALPLEYKIHKNKSKRILKDTFSDYLPPEHLKAPKRGFSIPLGQWFRGPMKTLAWDMLTSQGFRDRGIFNANAIEHLLNDHGQKRADHGQKIWALLVFEVWCRNNQ